MKKIILRDVSKPCIDLPDAVCSLGKSMFVILLSLAVAGCVPLKPDHQAYGYTPLSPVPAPASMFTNFCGCSMDSDILKLLPNESMHLSIAQVDGGANITYGPTAITGQNSNYIVVLDYIKSATKPFAFHESNDIPVYAGVGFRLVANLHAKKAGLSLGNLAAIGVAADAHDISGDLSIQLMGLSGQEITSALPIPTDISSATLQSALVAMGTIKSKIYDTNTLKTAQIVGVENIYGESVSNLTKYVESTLLGVIDAEGKPTVGLYSGNGSVQGSNYVMIYKFWTPSRYTKYDFIETNDLNLTEELAKLPKLTKKQVDSVPQYYTVDDAEKKIAEFGKKLEGKGLGHFDYYSSTGKGTTGLKRGYTWEVTVRQDHLVSRDEFIQLYSDFWGRKENIWLEQFPVTSSYEKKP